MIAPPYDLIDAARQDELYDRSPYNVVRLELGREADRYASAATLANGAAMGAQRAPRPAIYLYTQLFEIEGRRLSRDGFVARVRLEDFAPAESFPMSEPFPPPSRTGSNCSRAQHQCQFDFRPLLGRTPGACQSHAIFGATRGESRRPRHRQPVARDRGRGGNRDGTARARCSRMLIADGHHRYETALNFAAPARRRARPAAARPTTTR